MRIPIQGAKSMRIRILVRLLSNEKLNLYIKNILQVGDWQKNTYEGTQACF